MIDANELRKGVTFEMDGGLFKVLDYSHNKTARGSATVRIKARNLQTGANIERTFNSGQSVQDVRLDFHNVSYLYSDGDFFHFMDNETFEQPAIKAEMLGDNALYLKEGMEVKISFEGEEAILAEAPTFIEAQITYTEPGLKGDTATNTLKPAKIDTGTEIRVPLFVNEGDWVKIDTRTGDYVERVKK